MVKNVTPAPAFIHLATNLAVSLYMSNGVSGEYSGEILNAEIACAGAISKLAGLDPEKSAGVFTFGGTGTNLYALKIGLCKALPEHRAEGPNGKAVIIGSRSAHYCNQIGANWLGIGENNYVQVDSNLDQTTKLDQLEEKCREAIKGGKRIACISAVAGTTSNMGIDDIEAIFEMRERLVGEFNLPYKPHIHADAVLGWAYLNFIDYDFDRNPLGFGDRAIERLKKNRRTELKN
jgi:Glutamate decarboxylase and related PLP-dependent proteins